MEPMLTVDQVAERLQVNEYTVRRWLRAGEFEGVAFGGRTGWRVKEKDLQAFLERRRQGPETSPLEALMRRQAEPPGHRPRRRGGRRLARPRRLRVPPAAARRGAPGAARRRAPRCGWRRCTPPIPAFTHALVARHGPSASPRRHRAPRRSCRTAAARTASRLAAVSVDPRPPPAHGGRRLPPRSRRRAGAGRARHPAPAPEKPIDTGLAATDALREAIAAHAVPGASAGWSTAGSITPGADNGPSRRSRPRWRRWRRPASAASSTTRTGSWPTTPRASWKAGSRWPPIRRLLRAMWLA